MPEQVWTFWSLYLAKKSEGNAFKEDIYFSARIDLNLKDNRQGHFEQK